MRSTFDAVAMCIAAGLNVFGVRRVVLVGRITELPAPATDYLIGAIQRAAMWSRFDAVAVTLAPKRRARGLIVAGIQRFVMPADWSVKQSFAPREARVCGYSSQTCRRQPLRPERRGRQRDSRFTVNK